MLRVAMHDAAQESSAHGTIILCANAMDLRKSDLQLWLRFVCACGRQ